MYCPKCRTEYRKGFNTCADCEVALVEDLPPVAEKELPDNRLHPIRDQIGKTFEFIRNNQKATWIFSLLVGAIFYIAYIYSKYFWGHSIFRFIEKIASLINTATSLNNIKVILFVISANLITDIPAAFIASLFCASFMIYVLKKQQLRYFLVAVAAFFFCEVKWRFWKAPDIGLLVSLFIEPFMVGFIFILTAWLLIKFQFKISKD